MQVAQLEEVDGSLGVSWIGEVTGTDFNRLAKAFHADQVLAGVRRDGENGFVHRVVVAVYVEFGKEVLNLHGEQMEQRAVRRLLSTRVACVDSHSSQQPSDVHGGPPWLLGWLGRCRCSFSTYIGESLG